MSLALSTLLYEWRRYMAAVMALALSGLLVLGMAGVFIGIGKGFTATIERSSADVIVMQPGAKSLIGGPSGVPRRFIPQVYNNPEVVEVQPLDGAGGSFQSVKNVDPTKSAAERAREGAPKQNFVQASIIDTTPGAVTIPTDYSPELVEALRQPYTVAIDETALKALGVKLGDKALYNGQTVTVAAVLRGYPNMMQSTIVMSRDTLRMVGQADTGPRVGPLMVKLRDPARAEIVAAELNRTGDGQWKVWTRQALADANQSAMFEQGPLIIILGGVTVVGHHHRRGHYLADAAWGHHGQYQGVRIAARAGRGHGIAATDRGRAEFLGRYRRRGGGDHPDLAGRAVRGHAGRTDRAPARRPDRRWRGFDRDRHGLWLSVAGRP